MAAKHPETLYCCDICGEEELTEDDMRSHTMIAHIEGAISCPFCDLGDISADEMVYHVNTVHLQHLNPVGEKLKCIVNSSNSPDRLPLPDNNNVLEETRDTQCCSPHRSNLSLSLSASQWRKDIPNGCVANGERITTCPLCDYGDPSPTKLQEHVNRQHFDLTSPSFPEFVNCDRSHGRPFTCPLCNRNFETSPDLELHVNMDHHDILSPAKSTQVTPGDENSNECCPVCGCSNFNCGLELASHIEEHFSQQSPNGVIPAPRTSLNFVATISTDGDASADHLLALEMEHREREQQRLREQQEFRLLQAQYGMDNQGNFREQSITNMQRAVYAGEMSVTDYYNRQVELCIAERDGVDDGHSCIKGLIPKVRAFSMATANVEHTWLCTTIDHYGSTYGDKGWGCGYRNIQMLLSALVHHTGYNHRLFNGRNSIPSISKLQELIETAWRHGFDPQGCEQLGGRLINTRKWIGATEVVTFLSSFRIKCLLIDCHTPTGPNGTHPEMFNWVKEYFTRDEDFLSPIYLQHHGHSRTIIGIEELKDGELQLLVFDPSHSKAQMEQFNNTACNANAMRLLRRPLSALKARQYQLVTVNGLMESEEEFQRSKILRSQRIPPN